MSRCFALLAVLVGCSTTNTVTCDDGTVCPAASTCAPTEAGIVCATPEQVFECANTGERMACTHDGLPATCHGGACLVDGCGNGLVDSLETCDDLNTTAGDGCSANCLSTETCGNSIIDAVAGEECDLGDAVDHDGCSSTCRDENLAWSVIGIEHPGPLFSDVQMAYDAARRRVVLFGGIENPVQRAAIFEWDGRRWTRRTTTTAPANRFGASIAYDGARANLVMFGGSSQASDTWTWDGASWTLHTPSIAPSVRRYAPMVYDARHARTIILGGVSAETAIDDMWIWNGDDWSRPPATTTLPPARRFGTVAYDPVRGVVVLFGGDGFTDTWELDDLTWSQKATTGPALFPATASWNPASGKVTVVGQGGAGPEGWEWNGAAWTMIDAPGRNLPLAMAPDPLRGKLVAYTAPGELFERDAAGWTVSIDGTYSGAIPTGRESHVMVTDPINHRVIVFGGTTDVGNSVDGETWTWNGLWRQAASGPPPRQGAAAAFDRKRGQLVMFGGCDENGTPFGDTWIFDGTAWSERSANPSPTGSCYGHAAYDAKRDRVVLFGGRGGAGDLDETWTWDGVGWHFESAATKPPPASDRAMEYDPDRERVVLASDETWTWDGSTWANVTPAIAPTFRTRTRLAWDGARHRLVMIGGAGVIQSLDDVWEWDGARWDVRSAGGFHAIEGYGLAPAIDGAGVLLVGGRQIQANEEDPHDRVEDVLRLRVDADSNADRCSGDDADGDGKHGCDDPDCAWICGACGDTTCGAGETCGSCPADCGVCAGACGDFVCTMAETCAGDCP